MIYQDFIKKGLLKKEKINFDQINQVFKRAHRHLKSAKILLKNDDQEGCFQFAYQAMLLAGRALLFSYNLRPRAIGSHKIVIDFVERAIGKNYKILVRKFDKMRKKRHYLIYGIGLVTSKTEAKNAIKSAEDFLKIIENNIQKRNPQKKLFK
ncbi:MAG TPA: HEPN domain-containing protein [Candidatus Portnoybacteria bacterium]|nr:HEPN domain-containing protein [Candidatus Portnoybacteria bacterium]